MAKKPYAIKTLLLFALTAFICYSPFSLQSSHIGLPAFPWTYQASFQLRLFALALPYIKDILLCVRGPRKLLWKIKALEGRTSRIDGKEEKGQGFVKSSKWSSRMMRTCLTSSLTLMKSCHEQTSSHRRAPPHVPPSPWCKAGKREKLRTWAVSYLRCIGTCSYLLAVYNWASYFTSLCLSFLICKTELDSKRGHCENQMSFSTESI